MARRATAPPEQEEEKPVSASAAKLRLLKRLRCTLRYEKEAWAGGARYVAGVDEVGRGALFGPVTAAAVVLDPHRRIRGLRDSKLLDSARREELAAEIRVKALAFAVAEVDSTQIDLINIYQASRLAMKLAVERLTVAPDFLLIDALQLDHPCKQRGIIHGDALSISIAAASIIAKVERDGHMRELDAQFPGYGLASHKGYATPEHREALRRLGPTPLHRMSFAPCAQVEFGWVD
jgi:ribonuclease HII